MTIADKIRYMIAEAVNEQQSDRGRALPYVDRCMIAAEIGAFQKCLVAVEREAAEALPAPNVAKEGPSP